MKLILNILFFIILMNIKGNCQTIDEIGTNPTTTRTKCTYGFTPGTSIRFDYWLLPDANNAIPINSQGAPTYSLINNVILPLVWKNVEASSYPDSSILKVQYLGSDNAIHNATKRCGPFTLTFKSITFVGGTSKNIPCYSTGSITIAVNDYVNTGSDYDKDEWITHHFEWTLPSGWQTTTGQTGTFVSGPSINVIPPA